MLALACGNEASTENPQDLSPEERSDQVEQMVQKGSTKMSTETSVPVPEWVADILKSNPEDAKAIVCVEKGENLYFVNPCVSCPVQLTEVYNDKQEKVCYIGGPQQEITCPEFEFDGSKACKPVLLNSGGGHEGHNH